MPMPTLVKRTPTVLLFCLLLLYGCGAQNTRPVRPPEPDARAVSYLQQGDYLSAAAEFRVLADANPDQAVMYNLRAVDAYLDAGHLDTAVSLLDKQIIPLDKPVLRQQRAIMLAKIDLYRQQPDRALSLLQDTDPASLPAYLQDSRLRVLARAHEAMSNYTAAVEARITLSPYLTRTADSEKNTDRIWSDLNAMDPDSLQSVSAGGNEQLVGWVELALIYKKLLFKPPQLQQAVADWRRLYPNHPAQHGITSRILTQAGELNVLPRTVALLLPFTGPYKRAAEAIREGFLSAWYADAKYRPEIKIYDAGSLNINDIYQKAVNDGAGLIVGPLEKSAISTLSQSGAITVTTLALNQVNEDKLKTAEAGAGVKQARLYQFALAPEDEARQVADRGIFEGLNRVLIITPRNEWGTRLLDAFSSEWQDLGGSVMGSVQYDPNATDFSYPVERLLNITDSKARIAQLRRVLKRNIVSNSRRRNDADLIYMAAVPQAGRQIVPQFRYYRVDQLPIYSTSHVYSGTPDLQLDNDMNGVEFTDIPWVLRSRGEMPPIQVGIQNNWSSQTSPYRRLYAFGVDAFRLIPQLAKLDVRHEYRYNGQTGVLSMDADGRIRRQLSWARFVDGSPVPIKVGSDN
jgi:outer membrane PBP1 activator LpoA protein